MRYASTIGTILGIALVVTLLFVFVKTRLANDEPLVPFDEAINVCVDEANAAFRVCVEELQEKYRQPSD